MDDGFRFALPILLLRRLSSANAARMSGMISVAVPETELGSSRRLPTVEAFSRRVADGAGDPTHTSGHS